MEWSVFLPDRSRDIEDSKDYMLWLNAMAYRWFQGHFRYGKPKRTKMYLWKLIIEFAEYLKTGNCEHLRNISNYAYLESQAPSHPKFHDDSYADSATRQFMES